MRGDGPSVKVLERVYVTHRVRHSRLTAERAREEFKRGIARIQAEAWDEGFVLATRNSPTQPHPLLSRNPVPEGRER